MAGGKTISIQKRRLLTVTDIFVVLVLGFCGMRIRRSSNSHETQTILDEGRIDLRL